MTSLRNDEAQGETDDGQDGTGASGERGERSGTKYPYYDLEQAEEFALAVLELGGNEVLEDDLLKHLSLSRTTKSWIYKLSTGREFGLLERRGQKEEAKIILTELGRRLIQPSDERERAECRASTFLRPPLYRKLFERYEGAALPPVEFLANLLARDHKLVASVTKQAAEAFRASAEFAGLVNRRTGRLERTDRSESAAPGNAKSDNAGPIPSDENTAGSPSEFISHVFPLRATLKVTLPLPANLTPREVERIHRWMQTLPIEDEGPPAVKVPE